MASLNKIQIIGNTGRDAELRMTPNGKPVASFSVAVNRRGPVGEGGERREETEWFNIVIFGDRLTDFAQQYVTKGRLVYVEGRLQTRRWQDRENKERTTVEIIANDIQLLSGPRERETAAVAAGESTATAPFDPDKVDPNEIPF